MSLLNEFKKRLEEGAAGLQDVVQRRVDEARGVAPIEAQDQNMQFQGTIPNPLGDGSLLNVQIAIETREDAGGEHTRLRARFNAPILKVLAPSYSPRISHEQIDDEQLPALVRNLPGVSKVAKRALAIREEFSANLPTTVETGEQVSTVLEMDVKRARAVSTNLVQRLKDRAALVTGPEQWQVESTEQPTPDGGFRALMTMRGENKDGSQGPVNVEARMGVEYKRK